MCNVQNKHSWKVSEYTCMDKICLDMLDAGIVKKKYSNEQEQIN